MEAKYLVTLKKFLKSSDKTVVYTWRKFVVVVEFTGKCHFSEEDIGWTKGKRGFLFPYRINFRILHENRNLPQISSSTEEAENKAKWSKSNFIDDITFITDKGKTWNQYLQVSIIRVTEEECNIICKAIREN